jgi:beta-barrel assembly-enhancing protease
MPSDWTQVQPQAHAWRGHYTDGWTAASRVIEVRLEADGLRLMEAGTSLVWPYTDLATSEPVRESSGDVLVMSKAAPGATLFVRDRAFTQAIAARAPQTALKAFRMSGLRAAAPVGLLAFILAGTVWGFDLSPSKAVAKLMPDAARERLGANVLATLPTQPSTCITIEGRAALDALAKRLRPDALGRPIKVDVLNWSLVNAFAVPGGKVVLTRAIIERAANADEIAGVLAHEMGHSIELHPEAGLVRSVGFWALIQMVFTGSPGALGNAGTALAQLAYTRSYEREADTIALKLLKEAEISHRPFAGFFKKMGEKDATRSRSIFDNEVFQTHPATPDRVAMIEKQPDYPSRPALTAEQWQALKRICGSIVGTGRVDTSSSDIEAAKANPDARLKEADAKIAAAPTVAAHYAARGAIHLDSKRHAAAIADYARAIDLEPSNALHHFNRGRAHQNAERFDTAVADYTEAVRLNARNPSALAARGATYRAMNDIKAAQRDLDAALALNPRHEYALSQRGLLHATLQRWADSERDFTKIIEGNRSYSLAYARRGQAHEGLRRREAAIADYLAALEAAPSSPDAEFAFKLARERLAALGYKTGK